MEEPGFCDTATWACEGDDLILHHRHPFAFYNTPRPTCQHGDIELTSGISSKGRDIATMNSTSLLMANLPSSPFEQSSDDPFSDDESLSDISLTSSSDPELCPCPCGGFKDACRGLTLPASPLHFTINHSGERTPEHLIVQDAEEFEGMQRIKLNSMLETLKEKLDRLVSQEDGPLPRCLRGAMECPDTQLEEAEVHACEMGATVVQSAMASAPESYAYDRTERKESGFCTSPWSAGFRTYQSSLDEEQYLDQCLIAGSVHTEEALMLRSLPLQTNISPCKSPKSNLCCCGSLTPICEHRTYRRSPPFLQGQNKALSPTMSHASGSLNDVPYQDRDTLFHQYNNESPLCRNDDDSILCDPLLERNDLHTNLTNIWSKDTNRSSRTPEHYSSMQHSEKRKLLVNGVSSSASADGCSISAEYSKNHSVLHLDGAKGEMPRENGQAVEHHRKLQTSPTRPYNHAHCIPPSYNHHPPTTQLTSQSIIHRYSQFGHPILS